MRIIIELEIEGNAEGVFDAIDGALDAGTIQDAITDEAGNLDARDEALAVEIISASSRLAPDESALTYGCGTCLMGVVIMNGTEIQACDDCRTSGDRQRMRQDDDDAAVAFVGRGLKALADLREILWPGGDPEASWSPDTADAIGRRLAFLAPKGNAS